MPRIADHVLQSSIYLYRTVDAARAGERSGGCGFLVHVPSKHENMVHLYAVTNKHLLDRGFHVLRLNTTSGLDTIQSDRQSWLDHPDGHDVSVLPVEALDEKFKWFSIPVDEFISHEAITDFNIGIGDEAFLIGRLVTHEGKQSNTPIVRFGNLA